MQNFFSKYRIYIIISVVATIILVYLQFASKNSNKGAVNPSPTSLTKNNEFQTINEPTPSPLVFSPPPYTQPSLNSQGKVDTASENVKTAITTKENLNKSLPIYIKNFKISNVMSTTLNVYTIPEDPDYLVHIEIYGIDFENQDVSKESNPNVVAFIESFTEIKKQLSDRGVDIHNIYFVFGQRTYIQATADLWIKTFGLL